MSWFLRYGLPVVGIMAAVPAFIGLTALEALYILPGAVTLPVNERMSDWLAVFGQAEHDWVLFPALSLAAAWFLVTLATTSYKGDHRSVWFVLWTFDMLAAVVCIFLGKLEENTGFAPAFLTLLNAVILFWVATAPFSSITHKFAPAGSAAARKLW